MVAENIREVTDQNFEKEVLESPVPTIVDFWADWCGPCKALTPKLEELAVKYSGKVSVAKLNVDDNAATAGRYGVRGIPALILFKGGKNEDQLVGNQPVERIEDLFRRGLS